MIPKISLPHYPKLKKNKIFFKISLPHPNNSIIIFQPPYKIEYNTKHLL